ncbi:nickel pincer cofactor biosynthesis protein LarC [Chitinispirillales bacterium ANBcel5]|uniref:nickel pincer cofactor biosynthesis protein LarC n=1 Tax=Cellulosispirillum alkaliphilum TaxID=3039283 RepID=UPI002A510CAA|nr:nickel pincer cofactor biosynthesis protein LarC [Chitinispirillales bacterium ANBcel5]
MKKILYFDLVSGASGDMILSSLIDLGVPVSYLQEQLKRTSIPKIHISVQRKKTQGIESTQLKLNWEEQKHYRHIHQIMEIIESGNFSDSVVQRCSKVLNHLGSAEAKVHGVPLDRVHFHEIGAVDTVIDILGMSLCMEYLEVDHLAFSNLTVGHGFVNTEHGRMPVPVPATAEMLRGFSVNRLDIADEILTPTGCALLTALGEQSVFALDGTVENSGVGCGSKEFKGHPNVLRVFLLSSKLQPQTEWICQLETDLDHVSGEVMAHMSDILNTSGALDSCWIPIYMKKCRPGYRLSCLCRPEDRAKLIDLVIRNTRTLGVRWQLLTRTIAKRRVDSIRFLGEEAKEKVCSYGSFSFSKLEYESLVRISEKSKIPVLNLIEEYISSKTKDSE